MFADDAMRVRLAQRGKEVVLEQYTAEAAGQVIRHRLERLY
jgi:hypothetical protein